MKNGNLILMLLLAAIVGFFIYRARKKTSQVKKDETKVEQEILEYKRDQVPPRRTSGHSGTTAKGSSTSAA